MNDSPLGQKEDDHLEFKGRDALRDRAKIAREVVGLLNSGGGVVWIGIRDENGYGVEVEGIAKADSEVERLRDSLVDSVEPSPASGEVRVEPVTTQEGDVIRVAVQEGTFKPYALLGSGGSRLFVTRIGSRVRPMSHEEVAKWFGRTEAKQAQTDTQVRQAVEELLREKREIEEWGGVLGRKDGFWFQVRPARKLKLDLQDKDLEGMFMDPTRTGNRRAGWTFAGRAQPELLPGGRLISRSVWGPAQAQVGQEVELREDGVIAFSSSLSRLHWKGEPKEIYPLILLELPTSLLRFASAVYINKLDDDDLVLVDLALLGIEGWSLREGTPGDWFFAEEIRTFEGRRDLTLPDPFDFRFVEIRTQADRCGFRLVRRIYQEFGMREDALPAQFDPISGKLVLADG